MVVCEREALSFRVGRRNMGWDICRVGCSQFEGVFFFTYLLSDVPTRHTYITFVFERIFFFVVLFSF